MMVRASRNTAFLLTLLITLLGVLLRFTALTKESLWLDECFSVEIATRSWASALFPELRNPPLYTTLLRVWILGFGNSEAAIRSFSAVCSALLIPVWFFAARQYLTPAATLLSVAFLACSPFHIEYAQEARTFALLELFLCASAYYLLRGRNDFLYVASIVLAFYCHFIALFFFIGHVLFMLIRQPRSNAHRRIIPASICLIPGLIMAFLSAAGGGQERRYLWLKLPQTIFSFLFGDSLIPLDEHAVQNIKETIVDYSMSAVGAALCVLLLVYLVFRSRALKNEWQITWWFGIFPVLLVFIVSVRLPFFDERYLIGAAPFLFGAVAAAIESTCRRSEQYATGLFVGVFLTLTAVSLHRYFFAERFGKDQWRDVVRTVEALSQPSDGVLIDPEYVDGCYRYYQSHATNFVRQRKPGTPPPPVTEQLVGLFHRIWLVSIRYHDRQGTKLLNQFGYIERRHIEFPRDKGIDLYLFETSALEPGGNANIVLPR